MLWLLYTRRYRQAVIAGVGAVVVLIGSWAIIGFHGLSGYRRLLSADAHAFEARSHSVVALVVGLGGSVTVGTGAAVLCAAGLTLLVVPGARDRDHAAFTAAIVAGLLSSPILWSHYLVLLLVPLAVGRPRLDAVWLLFAGFWISPTEPAATIQVALVLALVVAITFATVRGPRSIAIRRLPAQ